MFFFIDLINTDCITYFTGKYFDVALHGQNFRERENRTCKRKSRSGNNDKRNDEVTHAQNKFCTKYNHDKKLKQDAIVKIRLMTEEELRTQYNVKKTGTTMTTQNINDRKDNPDGFPKYFQTILNKFGREDEKLRQNPIVRLNILTDKELKDLSWISLLHCHTTHRCTICSERFTTYENLRLHIREIHMTANVYKCHICDKQISNKNNLKAHIELHKGEKPYICNTCGKGYTTKSVLRVHSRIHTKDYPYTCDTCGKQFNWNTSYVLHKRMHTGNREYTCSHCGKHYISNGVLQSHIKFTHTMDQDKPLTCKTCGKRFVWQYVLSRHEKRHTGLKPYKCDICGRKISTKDNLKRHLVTHEGDHEKPFVCGTCGERFLKKGGLTRHMLIHTGERPHVCNICEKTFKLKSDLTQHRNTHTNQKAHMYIVWEPI